MFKRRNGKGSNGNLRVGRAQVRPDAPSHIKGIRMGNEPGSLAREAGFEQVDGLVKATAERATGINPQARNPIDPRMPNLPPA
jgi:hypothetical protein